VSRRSLKLFVVGENSGNPNDWSTVGWRALVAAQTPEQAVSLAPRLCRAGGVAQLDVSEPMVLFEEENGPPDD
jgi:hypothetical protein